MRAIRKITSLATAIVMTATAVSFSAFVTNAEDTGIVINEVCLGNNGENGNLTDVKAVYEKKGATVTELCDWIELYNPSDSAVDVSGYQLAKTDLGEIEPSVKSVNGTAVVPAKGYLVLYCNKELDDTMVDSKPYIKMNLSAKGLDLDFQTGASESVNTLTVPSLEDDTTYARIPDGSDSFKTVYPTPGISNNNAQDIPGDTETSVPEFSKNSGAFTDSFSLEISAEDGAEIYYTIDGSTPTAESTKYTEAITVVDRSNEKNVLSAISKDKLTDSDHRGGGGNAPTVKVDKATVIRAIAIKNGVASAVVTKSYFVGKTNETYAGVPIISIVTDADNLFDDEIGIYLQKNCTNKGKEWERPVHIDYIKDNEAVLSQDCGIRIQGGYSRGEYQKSLRFYAKSDYGEKSFKYDFFDGKAKDRDGNVITSFKRITLRNGGNDANYVKYKDSLIQNCVLDRNFSTQASVPCIAFINGEYWGIYTMQEDYNDDYVESHFGVDKDNVVMIKPDTSNNNAPKIEEGEDEDVELWNDFVKYVKNSSKDFSKKADYQEIANMIDLDSFADYIATETYISNEDWSGKNWEVWRSRTVDTENGGKYSDGKWRFMIYDVEMGAFLWGNAGESSVNDKLYQIYNGGKSKYDPIQTLVYKLMQNPDFAQKVFDNIEDLAKNSYEPSRVMSIMTQLHDLYYPNLEKYFQRFPSDFNIWWAPGQCEDWLKVFFNGGNNNGQYYAARDVYALDMIKYNKAVVKCDSLKQSDCVSGYNEMFSKLKTLKSRLENTKSTYQSKENAYESFIAAYNNMVLNKSGEVKELLFDSTSIKRKDNYSDDQWSDFNTAYNQLVDVYNDPSADDDLRTKAIDDLKTALKNIGIDIPENPTNTSQTVSQNPSETTNTTTASKAKTTRSADVVKKDKDAANKAMKQAKITKLNVKSKAKKKITLSWKKVSKAKGYQVQVSAKKNFKKIIFKKFTTKKKLTIKNLKIKSKKTYFIRVRAYTTYLDINGKPIKVYSKWNKKLKKIKVK